MSDAILDFFKAGPDFDRLHKCGGGEWDGCSNKVMIVASGLRRCKQHSPYQIRTVAWINSDGIYAIVPSDIVAGRETGWQPSNAGVLEGGVAIVEGAVAPGKLRGIAPGKLLWWRMGPPWAVGDIFVAKEPIDLLGNDSFQVKDMVPVLHPPHIKTFGRDQRVGPAPLHPMRVALLALDPNVKDPTFSSDGRFGAHGGIGAAVRLMNRGRDGWDIIPGANPETVDPKYWDRVCELVRQVPWAQDEGK